MSYDYNKNKLLGEFLAVFIKNGIEKTGMRLLCQCANVNPNTVYRIFESKEEIIIACGMYVIENMERELKNGLGQYVADNVATGEFIFKTFKKHRDEVRFCIQIMTSPNEGYSQLAQHFAAKVQKNIHNCSNIVAKNIGAEEVMFEDKFWIFMSVMYYYCMTGDETNTMKQRYALYEEVKRIVCNQ